MVQLLGRLALNQRQGMVPRVAVKENQVADVVADLHPQHIAVERHRPVQIFHMIHHVTQPLLPRHKPRDRPRRVKRLVEAHRRPVVNLRRRPFRILELDQPLDLAFLDLRRRPLRHLNPRLPQLLRHFPQRRLVRDLKPHELHIIPTRRADDEAMGVLIHPHRQNPVAVNPVGLHPQHFRAEMLPLLQVADADTDVSQLGNTGHNVSS